MTKEEVEGLFERLMVVYGEGDLKAVIRLLCDACVVDSKQYYRASLVLVGHLPDEPAIETSFGRLLAFAPGVVLFVPDGYEVSLRHVGLLVHTDDGIMVMSRSLNGSQAELKLLRPSSPAMQPIPVDVAWFDRESPPDGFVGGINFTSERQQQLEAFLEKWLPIL
ncbi:MAG: hypothetical protein ABIJ46_02655 [bacterium]